MKQQGRARAHVYEPSSDATRGTELSNHTDRSGTTVHGAPSIAFGALFAIVGTAVGVAAVLGIITMSGGIAEWLGPILGAIFALAGVSFIVHGIAGMRVERRVRRLRETHVREPWVWDHPWDDRGSVDDSGRRIGRAVWFAGFLSLFVIPFNWIGFFAPEPSIIFAFVAGGMDLLLVGTAWRVIYLLGQRAKYGPAMLRFRRFPFKPGDEIEVHLARPAHLAGVDSPEAVLRCVQERYEIRGSGDDRAKQVVAYELWSARRAAEFKRGEYVWRFPVPEDAPGTALSERPPRYWEVEVKVEVPGVDFAGTFLVPVYTPVRGA